MLSVAVTGAAGSVARRLLDSLGSDPGVVSVMGLDRRQFRVPADKVLPVEADLLTDDLAPIIDGCDVLVHLAEARGDGGDPASMLSMFDRVLDAASRVGVGHLVFLSSAMVYGAHEDNRIPLTEGAPGRPNRELSFAVTKARLEEKLVLWAAETDTDYTILRPTTTLSPRESSWVAGSLRLAAAVRPPAVDPPVQFLHHDDLNTAILLVLKERMTGIVNVAPDGWISPDEFRELAGTSQVRVPNRVGNQIAEARRRFAKRPPPAGLESYVLHPWVISNDRLRSAGWQPTYSNEESFVIGTPAPPWSVPPAKRQEIALGLAGVAVAAVAAAAGAVAKRVSR